MKKRLYDEFIKRLVEVNDETKTEQEHSRLQDELHGWKQGMNDALGYRFNGDYFYDESIKRPMCAGEFLDWKHKEE